MIYLTVLRAAMTLACVTPLAACNSLQSGAEKVVRDSLKDPDSARFGEFFYNEKTKKACVTVNAKNSMGGYTGDHQAVVQKTDKGWEYLFEEEVSQDICKKAIAMDS